MEKMVVLAKSYPVLLLNEEIAHMVLCSFVVTMLRGSCRAFVA